MKYIDIELNNIVNNEHKYSNGKFTTETTQKIIDRNNKIELKFYEYNIVNNLIYEKLNSRLKYGYYNKGIKQLKEDIDYLWNILVDNSNKLEEWKTESIQKRKVYKNGKYTTVKR